MRIPINVILEDIKQTQLFRAADLFTEKEVIGVNFSYDFELGEYQLDHLYLEKLQSLLTNQQYTPVALWVANQTSLHLINWNIFKVSNGKSFYWLHPYLEKNFNITYPRELLDI